MSERIDYRLYGLVQGWRSGIDCVGLSREEICLCCPLLYLWGHCGQRLNHRDWHLLNMHKQTFYLKKRTMFLHYKLKLQTSSKIVTLYIIDIASFCCFFPLSILFPRISNLFFYLLYLFVVLELLRNWLSCPVFLILSYTVSVGLYSVIIQAEYVMDGFLSGNSHDSLMMQ